MSTPDKFIPSIGPELPDEEDQDKDLLLPPPAPTLNDRIRQLFRQMSIKRWIRQAGNDAKRELQRRRNRPGTKFVKRCYKAKHGHKAETAQAAWDWYDNLAEPKLRAGASRHERMRLSETVNDG